MRPLALGIIMLLAACGADGPPIAPERPAEGLRISGTAEFGVAVRP
jgi:hypothetical protein